MGMMRDELNIECQLPNLTFRPQVHLQIVGPQIIITKETNVEELNPEGSTPKLK